MSWRSLKEQIKPSSLVLSLLVLCVCAMVQFANFSTLMESCLDYRYISVYWEYDDNLDKMILHGYFLTRAGLEYYQPDVWYEIIDYWDQIPLWVTEQLKLQGNFMIRTDPPILTNLLSQISNIPILISMLLLLPILILAPIERDYRPNKSVLTFLRIPQSRSRYLLAKLINPVVLVFLFWTSQFCVALAQTAMYFHTVPESVRPAGASPWVFDYYRILFPVVEPIWFPATICALCLVPLIIVTFVFLVKGGMKGWIYGVLPLAGAIAVVLTVCRVSNMWWITPILLIAVYLNGRTLVNNGQIVQ